MKTEEIENLFVNFILKQVGPTETREEERNSKLQIVKQLIENSLSEYYPDLIPHIFPYGSFPIKTYLKEADIDITIIFENKNTHQILIDLSQEIINSILYSIKDCFENYNLQIRQNLFVDINIINADIQLIKCKMKSISFDISINNYFGLLKILFMNFIFNQIELKNNNLNGDNKLIMFRKTILLIKAWCISEGNLIGSNIGLMASYALEILILYMFNIYHKEIENEIDGFFYFFYLTFIRFPNNQ